MENVIRIRLAEIAVQQGMSMSRVQQDSGLTMGMVRRYWYNRTKSVQLREMVILCRLLGVSAGEMLVIEEG